MSIQNDVLFHKNQGKKQRLVDRILGINRETVSRYWNAYPEEALQEFEWVVLLNWDYITGLQRPHSVSIGTKLSENTKSPTYLCLFFGKNLRSQRKPPGATHTSGSNIRSSVPRIVKLRWSVIMFSASERKSITAMESIFSTSRLEKLPRPICS